MKAKKGKKIAEKKVMNNCNKIRDLEGRLLCLQEKYNQLTDQLEHQRTNSSSDEGILDYHNIIEERRLIERYMQRLTNQLDKEEESASGTTTSDTIGPGRMVLLVNNDHKLKLRLVNTIYSGEEKQISVDSPIGKAVLGKRVGESVIVNTPKGKINYKIASIE